jgi:hypothetical protein
MGDATHGTGWWLASDGQWYPTGMPDPSPLPAKRGRRRPVILSVATVVLVAMIATVVVEAHSGDSDADAAVISAVDTAIAGKTAAVSATGSVVAAGTTATFSGTGSVDFTNSAVSSTKDCPRSVSSHRKNRGCPSISPRSPKPRVKVGPDSEVIPWPCSTLSPCRATP